MVFGESVHRKGEVEAYFDDFFFFFTMMLVRCKYVSKYCETRLVLGSKLGSVCLH